MRILCVENQIWYPNQIKCKKMFPICFSNPTSRFVVSFFPLGEIGWTFDLHILVLLIEMFSMSYLSLFLTHTHQGCHFAVFKNVCQRYNNLAILWPVLNVKVPFRSCFWKNMSRTYNILWKSQKCFCFITNFHQKNWPFFAFFSFFKDLAFLKQLIA